MRRTPGCFNFGKPAMTEARSVDVYTVVGGGKPRPRRPRCGGSRVMRWSGRLPTEGSLSACSRILIRRRAVTRSTNSAQAQKARGVPAALGRLGIETDPLVVTAC